MKQLIKHKSEANKNIINMLLILMGICFLIYLINVDLVNTCFIEKNIKLYTWQEVCGTKILKPEEEAYQDFYAYFSFCELGFAYEHIEDSDGTLEVVVKNLDTQEIVYNKEFYMCDAEYDGSVDKLVFSLVTEKNKKIPAGNYRLEVKNSSSRTQVAICLQNVNYDYAGLNPTDNEYMLNLYVNTSTNIRKYIGTAVLIILFLYIISLYVYKQFVDNIKPEKFFLISAIPLGLAYMILFLPWSVPDSGSHFYAIYRFSNIIMHGKSYSSDAWFGRMEDVSYLTYVKGIGGANPTTSGYLTVWDHLHLLCKDSSVVDIPNAPNFMKFYSIINYFPCVIGVIIGRLLNLGIIFTMYLARFIENAFFIFVLYCAIKRTPIGKIVVAFVSLLPITLMNLNGFTYDGMLVVVSICFITSILAYNESRSNSTFALTVFWAFMLGGTKGGGYLLLLPLVFILIRKPLISKENLKVASILFSAIFSILLWNVILQRGNDSFFQLGNVENENLYAMYALKRPLNFIKMCIRAYISNADTYFWGVLGNTLGWLEATVPHFVIGILTGDIVLAAVLEKDEAKITKRWKILIIIVIMLALFATPIMLLSATPVDSKMINGIQGRYFLPLLVLVFQLFKKSKDNDVNVVSEMVEDTETMRMKKLEKCMFVFAWLSVVSVYYILKLYLSR